MCAAGLAFGGSLPKAGNDQLAQASWAYFEARCRNESGEKVYETFPHVNSVLVLKPAAAAAGRSEQVAGTLLGTVRFAAGQSQRGFDFVEMLSEGDPKGDFVRISAAKDASQTEKRHTTAHTSRFALLWEDVSTPEDRKHRVVASRLRIIDLLTDFLVAERVRFAMEPGATCPALVNGIYEDRGFILSVLKPGDG